MENPNGKKKRKRTRRGGEAAPASFDRDVFPILLAAVAPAAGAVPNQRASSSSSAAATRLLRRFLSRSQEAAPLSPIPTSLVALLPLLLSSSSHSVAALSCEVMGAAALQSMEAGEALASDGGIATGLARALGSGSRRVAEAACNAMMDLSASPVCRERLSGSPVLPRLLWTLYLALSAAGATSAKQEFQRKINVCTWIVYTVVLMVNSCKLDKLHNLQQELVRKVMHMLYAVWVKVGPLGPSADCSIWNEKLQSRPCEISEAIFRLSMDLAYPAHVEPDQVRKRLFGQMESDFDKFVLAYWENSPHLYRRKQSGLEGDPVFTALHGAFDLTTPDAIIEPFVQGLVSCPAIASDELNINSFLHEVCGSLGGPVKYRQDVRVVRTQDQTSTGSGIEEHFFDDGMVFQDAAAFVDQCKDAIKNGFSIALRGIEFRSEKVAAIASALADMFGQPSVGANIYFSPPKSQGLARHYDDHCVLVWQLLGRKRWKIWPNARSILPRLYEPFDSLDDLVDDSGARVEVLHEGDTMYVPRGCVHEAHTDVDDGESEVNASTNYSLHLTLAIEVEPPFEWEGFAHIALRRWLEEHQFGRSSGFLISKVEEQAPLFALLLHVAIRLLSDSYPTLRKACMVASKLPSSSNSCLTTCSNSLRSSHRSTFTEILNKIDRSFTFNEALRLIELAVRDKNDEPFQWMSWIRHLPQQQKQHGDVSARRIDFCNVLGHFKELLNVFGSNREQALAEFAEFRSRFCRSVVYEDVCEGFKTLLKMYRTVRNQYMRGMLALHGRHGG